MVNIKDKNNLSTNWMDQLKTEYRGFTLYNAGLPDFPRNFTRDSIISAILCRDSKMLENQLNFCTYEQGTKKNPKNGEEPGKIHHEYPGFEMPNSLCTTYNACDTTALFLIGHYFYQELTKDGSLAKEQEENINQATEYIIRHINKNGFFIENPKFCENDKFALKTTYWKDSCLIDRDNGTPVYPVVYTLPHIQNLDGLRKAQNILDGVDISDNIKKMESALPELYDDELGTYYLAIDEQGPIKGISSDSLHSLYYLDPKDTTSKQLKEIVKASEVLETPIGYRTLDSALASKSDDYYHVRTVWPFEQAIINSGAMKHRLWAERHGFAGLAESLRHVEEVSSRIIPKLYTYSELYTVDDKGNTNEGGCNPQLWSIAAKDYFESSRPSY